MNRARPGAYKKPRFRDNLSILREDVGAAKLNGMTSSERTRFIVGCRVVAYPQKERGRRMRGNRVKALTGFLVSIALIGAGLTGGPVTSAQAAAPSGSEFDPGNIISDQNFFNGGAMNAAEVQSFLNGQYAGCAAGYTCLRDYAQAVPSMASSAYCAAVAGSARMSAAQIIAAVGVACNISPKVMLVLLQKEQSLVTHTAPSATRYEHATGFSCPDTAPCDPAFAGFFYQVYYAARQFQIYRIRPNSFNFQAGGTFQILYHPNAACGRRAVYITNQATAGLYNYTPYTPNAAALANMYGTGDGCSSYGNRNFWRLWWDWFGSPTTISGGLQIANLYEAQGGASGWLGAATTPVTSVASGGGGLVQTYVGGAIYWSAGSGAHIVAGAVLASYQARGGPASTLGWPNGPTAPVTLNGAVGEGQGFQAGSLYVWSGGAFAVYEPMRSAYWNAVGADSAFGWPTADPVCGLPNGGCSQTFQGGSVYSSSVSGQRWLAGAYDGEYRAHGGPSGNLGWPLGGSAATLDGETARAEAFQNGTIYGSTAGIFTVSEPIRSAYWTALGSGHAVGWPTANQTTSTLRGGGVLQAFRGGTIVSSAAGGQAFLTPQAVDAFTQAGGVATVGWPSGSAAPLTLNAQTGSGQGFQSASIYQSALGTFAVIDPVRQTYWGSLGAGQPLGWPTSVPVPVTLGSQPGTGQAFQGGSIYSSPSGVFSVPDPIRQAYWGAIGAGRAIGWPVTAVVPVTLGGEQGSGQAFQGGSIYRSSTGSFAVLEPVRAAYWGALGQGRAIGWPTSNLTCDSSNICRQEFQGATITTRPGQAVEVVDKSPFAEAYALLGGPTGSLGPSISGATSFVFAGETGLAQSFRNGSMYGSTAGMFAVLEPIRGAYWGAIGQGRAIGWPIANAVCDSTTCTQEFQGATITSRPGRVDVIDKTPFAEAYAALGGATGPLGPPTSGAAPLVFAGETGLAQGFRNGSMYKSTAGVFAVLEPIRGAYWGLLGAGKPFGWPTANQVAATGGTWQSFQGGAIYRTPGGSAIGVSGAFLTEYTIQGGPAGTLGWPQSAEGAATLGGVPGVGQSFQRGTIYQTSLGTFTILDPIRTAYWNALGAGKQIGWPTSVQVCGLPSGECKQTFQFATIYSTPTGGTRIEF